MPGSGPAAAADWEADETPVWNRLSDFLGVLLFTGMPLTSSSGFSSILVSFTLLTLAWPIEALAMEDLPDGTLN